MHPRPQIRPASIASARWPYIVETSRLLSVAIASASRPRRCAASVTFTRRGQSVVERRMLLELRNHVEKSDAIARDLAGAEPENIVQRVFRCRAAFRRARSAFDPAPRRRAAASRKQRASGAAHEAHRIAADFRARLWRRRTSTRLDAFATCRVTRIRKRSSPRSNGRARSVSTSDAHALVIAVRYPCAVSWRKSPFHVVCDTSLPMPKTDSRSWPLRMHALIGIRRLKRRPDT